MIHNVEPNWRIAYQILEQKMTDKEIPERHQVIESGAMKNSARQIG
jgi:hypothetical protein